MTIFYLGYNLQNGYIHNWLVAGPQAIPVAPAPWHRNAGLIVEWLSPHRLRCAVIRSLNETPL